MISIPLSTYGTDRLLNFLAGQLNFSYGGMRLVPGVVILQVILALVVPQVAAFLPIWKGTGISVQEALSGIRQGGAGPPGEKILAWPVCAGSPARSASLFKTFSAAQAGWPSP